MTDFGDEEIKELFEELRREDEAASPPFEVIESLPARPPTGSRRPARLGLALGLGAIAVLFGFAILLGVWAPGEGSLWTPPSHVVQVSELSRWRSPTASLLHSSAAAFLSRDLELGSTLDLPPVERPDHSHRGGGTKEKP